MINAKDILYRLTDEEKQDLFDSLMEEKCAVALDEMRERLTKEGKIPAITDEQQKEISDHIVDCHITADEADCGLPYEFLNPLKKIYIDDVNYYLEYIANDGDSADDKHDSAHNPAHDAEHDAEHDSEHDSAANEEIKVTCYGKTETWKSRADAMAFYFRGMVATSGSERERYTEIYEQLACGSKECHD